MAGGTRVGNLAVVLSGDAAPLRMTFANAKKDARAFAGDMTAGFGGKAGGLFAGLAGGAAGGPALMAATVAMTAATTAGNLLSSALTGVAEIGLSAAKTAVRAAAEYELMAAAFEVMTGSAEKGKKLLGDIQALAVATPFGTAELTKAGQMLLGMGVATDSVLPALSRLGDLSAGDAVKLDRLALAYGQVQAAGRFMGTELRQFTEAGVGVADFAKAAGMSMSQFRAAMESGAISADVVTKAVNDLTSSGGRFAGMNAKASQTVMGQWNALTESLTISLQRIGTAAFGKLDVAGRLGRVADWLGGMEQQAGPLLDVLGKAGGLIDDLWAGVKTLANMAGEFGAAWMGQAPTMTSVRDFVRDAMFGGITWVARLADALLFLQRQVEWLSREWRVLGGVISAAVLAAGVYTANPVLMGVGAAGTAAWLAQQVTPGGKSAKELSDGTGMVSAASRAWLKNLEGGFEAMKKTAKEAAKIPVEAGKMSASMEAAAAAVRGSMQDDPLTRFRKEMASLPSNKQFPTGLNKREMDFGMMQAFEKLEKEFANVKPAELPKALMRYSTEAESAVVKAMTSDGSKDWQGRVEKVLEEARAYQEATWRSAAEIADAVRKFAPVAADLK